MRSCLVIVTAASNGVTRVVLDGCYRSIGTALAPPFLLARALFECNQNTDHIFWSVCHITLVAGINFFYTRYLLMSYTLKLFVFLM